MFDLYRMVQKYSKFISGSCKTGDSRKVLNRNDRGKTAIVSLVSVAVAEFPAKLAG